LTGNVVARRYARALFALGKKNGLPELENYASGLGAIRTILQESPSLAQFFRNPIFSPEEKKQTVAQLITRLKLSGVVVHFCFLLAEKDRLRELDRIATVFDQLLDAEKGVIRGELLTAIPMDAAKQTAIVKQLEKKTKHTLMLSFGVSPEILGGVVLKVGDQVMDASLRAQLSILKDTIKRGE
jgi:F-type H+-transporting ATPase subunit delta